MFKSDKVLWRKYKSGKGNEVYKGRESTVISAIVFREDLTVVNNQICLNHN